MPEVTRFTQRGTDAASDECYFFLGLDDNDDTGGHLELEVEECAVAGLAIPTRPGGFKARPDAESTINTPRKEGGSASFRPPGWPRPPRPNHHQVARVCSETRVWTDTSVRGGRNGLRSPRRTDGKGTDGTDLGLSG